jgi:hypothetical protein
LEKFCSLPVLDPWLDPSWSNQHLSFFLILSFFLSFFLSFCLNLLLPIHKNYTYLWGTVCFFIHVYVI